MKEETKFWIVMFFMIVATFTFTGLNFITKPAPGEDITVFGFMAMMTFTGTAIAYVGHEGMR